MESKQENKSIKLQRMGQILNKDRGETILDDLIGSTYSSNDTSFFVRRDNKKAFDIITKFGHEQAKLIFENAKFEIPIPEHDLDMQIAQLEKCKSQEELIKNSAIRHFNTKYKSELAQNFEETRNHLINELIVQKQKSNRIWMDFVSNADEKLVETNTWTIYIGFLFISFSHNENNNKKAFFAPLFLKEVQVIINNGRAVLKADGPIIKNAKIFQVTKSCGFDLEMNEELNNSSISQVVEIVKELWATRYSNVLPESILKKTPRLSFEDITHYSIHFHPGMLLGLFEPIGGYIRSRMNEIISQQKIEGIIDVSINKKKYTKLIENKIFDFNVDPKEGEINECKLIKVTPTNYSQDRATISALNQHTIIWGPPGTGKSQTIGNIIANILFQEKTALVVSEKRAALDVLRKRLGRLSKFALFLLADKNNDIFYDPIIEYIDTIEHADDAQDINEVAVYSKDEKVYFNAMSKLSTSPEADLIFSIIESVARNNISFNKELYDILLKLSKFNLKYPKDISLDGYFVKKILRFNKLSALSPRTLLKKHRETSKSVAPLLKKLLSMGDRCDDLQLLIDLVSKVSDKNNLAMALALIARRRNIDQSKPISSDKEIEKILTASILQKIEDLPLEFQREYKDFATAAKLKKENPFYFLKKYINVIKVLFPIIITTPSVDLSNWEENEFDYCIVDECSQVRTHNGLPALYLAKIKVLVGDEQQMRPSDWFVKKLSNPYWGDNDSLLDFAATKGVYKVHLEKNYRSNKSLLMAFSNKTFYDSKLDIIDTNSKNKEQAIEVINISTSLQESEDENDAELKVVVQKAKENLYKYKTIIILTFNAIQMDKIREYIFQNDAELGDAILSKKLMVKNLENIQGEEANLVIISVSYKPTSKLSSSYIGRKSGRHSLNVAITRAIDKMIVVKSIKAQDIKLNQDSDDLQTFRNWIRFLDMSEVEKYQYVEPPVIDDENKLATIANYKQKIVEKITWEINHIFPTLPKGVSISLDHRIGLQKIDIAILKNDELKLGLNVDYSQLIGKEKFIFLRDNNLFLRAKGHNIYLLDPIVWATKRNEFIELIRKL